MDMAQTEETAILFRPVGAGEMNLIRRSGYRIFPPRLTSQPIFYPVLSQEYAEEIARNWNTKDVGSGFAGLCYSIPRPVQFSSILHDPYRRKFEAPRVLDSSQQIA